MATEPSNPDPAPQETRPVRTMSLVRRDLAEHAHLPFARFWPRAVAALNEARDIWARMVRQAFASRVVFLDEIADAWGWQWVRLVFSHDWDPDHPRLSTLPDLRAFAWAACWACDAGVLVPHRDVEDVRVVEFDEPYHEVVHGPRPWMSSEQSGFYQSLQQGPRLMESTRFIANRLGTTECELWQNRWCGNWRVCRDPGSFFDEFDYLAGNNPLTDHQADRLARLAVEPIRETLDPHGEQLCDDIVGEAWRAMRRLRCGIIPPRPAGPGSFNAALDAVQNWVITHSKGKQEAPTSPGGWFQACRNLVRGTGGRLCPVLVGAEGISLLQIDGTYSPPRPLPNQPLLAITELTKRYPNTASGGDINLATGSPHASAVLNRAVAKVPPLKKYLIRPGRRGNPHRAGYGLVNPWVGASPPASVKVESR